MARTKTSFGRDPGLQFRIILTIFFLGLLYVALVGAMFERLCIQADLPKPKIAVADTAMPNAFAMGRSKKSAVVCATTGIMNTLTPTELEGVMAHELAHVKNRDVLIMTMASFFASLASMIAQFAFFFGGSDDDTPAGLIVFLVSMLVYVISFFLMLALSRYR